MNPTNTPAIAGSLTRHTLTAGGVAGLVSAQDDILKLVSLLVTVIGLVWSIYEKIGRRPRSEDLPLLLACTLPAALLLGGCSTTTPSPDVLNRAATAAKLAAYVGSAEFMREHPVTRLAFERARDQLKLIETSEHVDLITILAIVQQLPVEELKSPQARLIVTAATLVLTDLSGVLPVSQLDNLKPIAQAIREGIDLALLAQPAPPK